eukprot:gnl/TRDRNA2_/TRDRNA2_91784_c0_seq2.p1 gnl/TRDRNA2_/TRDRNA2_91784_c0~~gnl/TRDRNA2_/TRDRNA2_91784_c0_seq2.p1  ORF type:complete len:347 (-),score=32.70 gnl/TRDRNA2_/TRDRNA2_91784_c0_seq2:425-1465(-)
MNKFEVACGFCGYTNAYKVSPLATAVDPPPPPPSHEPPPMPSTDDQAALAKGGGHGKPKKKAEQKSEWKPLADAAGVPRVSVSVPESVYGVATMCGVLYEISDFSQWCHLCGETYLRLLLNHILQLLLLAAVYQLYLWQLDVLEAGEDCFALSTPLFIANQSLLVVTMLTDMQETWTMCEMVLWMMPTVNGTSQCLRYAADPDGNLTLAAGGMSQSRKAWVTAVVLGPKFVIALLLLGVGGMFLASSGSNTDLIMNNLAIVFVFDVDEMIFNFLTPRYTRAVIAEIPPFAKDDLSEAGEYFYRFAIWWKFMGAILAIVILWMMRPANCLNDPCDSSTCFLPGILHY